jgi:hypothetical protein
MPAIDRIFRAWSEQLYEGFTETERAASFEYLRRMAENIGYEGISRSAYGNAKRGGA